MANLLTPREASGFAKMHVSSIYRLCKESKLKYKIIEGAKFIDGDYLGRYLYYCRGLKTALFSSAKKITTKKTAAKKTIARKKPTKKAMAKKKASPRKKTITKKKTIKPKNLLSLKGEYEKNVQGEILKIANADEYLVDMQTVFSKVKEKYPNISPGYLGDMVWTLAMNSFLRLETWDRALVYLEKPEFAIFRDDNIFYYIDGGNFSEGKYIKTVDLSKIKTIANKDVLSYKEGYEKIIKEHVLRLVGGVNEWLSIKEIYDYIFNHVKITPGHLNDVLWQLAKEKNIKLRAFNRALVYVDDKSHIIVRNEIYFYVRSV